MVHEAQRFLAELTDVRDRADELLGHQCVRHRREQVVNTQTEQRELDLLDVLCGLADSRRGNVGSTGDGCQSHEQIDFFGKVLGIQGGSHEELSGTLRVTDVGQLLLTGGCQNMVDEGWKILSRHVFLVEVPVLLRVSIVFQMSVRELRTSVVAKPYIVAQVSQHKRRSD